MPRFEGEWIREDGTYQLIISISDEETLNVSYRNPHPIHVASAEIRLESDEQHLVVVLQDTNYPNAIYDLTYNGENDRLTGTYYNPRAGRPFPVAFVRQ